MKRHVLVVLTSLVVVVAAQAQGGGVKGVDIAGMAGERRASETAAQATPLMPADRAKATFE
jgi:hypothetical protein